MGWKVDADQIGGDQQPIYVRQEATAVLCDGVSRGQSGQLEGWIDDDEWTAKISGQLLIFGDRYLDN
jgi:hypothetical protein